MTRHLVWRRVDEPGMEIAHVESLDRASGTQIGASYELRWRLDGQRLELEVVGERTARVDLEDADFFDVFASPFFNSLPVLRDGLLDGGEARTYTMRFVRVPELDTVLSEQRYEPLGVRFVRYSSAPASRAVMMSSVAVLAVIMTMGMNESELSALRRRHTSVPSILGIMMSSKIRSGRISRATARASCPSVAVRTS